MPAPFRPLSRAEFINELMSFAWTRRVWRVDMHHTFRPSHADYDGAPCIERMCRFHVDDRKWDDIAQHVSIAPDGVIWTGRDWNKTPASVGGVLNQGAFMFEAIGNFDAGQDVLKDEQLQSVTHVIRAVQRRFRLPPEALLFHRDVPVTVKTCPGTSVDKADILRRVMRLQLPQVTPVAVAMRRPALRGTAGSAAAAR
jgi:N-acetylmuramoyl-L-alanine amidase